MQKPQKLLEKTIKAHGGKRQWNSINEITARIRIGGLLPLTKFVSSALKRVEITVSTNTPYTVISPYPSRGYQGIFERNKVYIKSENGEITDERAEPRSYFKTFRHNLWWDYLDALYFVGYASWNYLCTPFLFQLEGFEIYELKPCNESGEEYERLRVVFPKGVPTHSLVQTFYFDSQGLLKRLDYTAEVVGRWARAAHYCYEHEIFSGITIATRRRVFPRRGDGKANSFPLFVSIDVEDVRLS